MTPLRLEMLTKAVIYKYDHHGEQWEMWGVDDTYHGICKPTPGDDDWFARCGEYIGFRKMRCYTQFMADDVDQGK